MLKLTNPFLEEVKECKKRDHKLMEKLVLIKEGKEIDFGVDENGVVRYRERVCVPELREMILERIGKVAYRIALPPSLSNLHDVFHVSQLRKYVADPSHVIESDDVQVRDNLTVETI
ncbi:hypothetical protein A2U01_0059388, partial [Trifolium medium]|nr:hypothetical protein [Trifolium medium]